MAPRKRLRRNHGLEPNLYASDLRGVTYFSYRHPQTGKRHGMGTNRQKANAAARVLNSRLMAAGDLVGEVMGTAGHNVAALIKAYRTDVIEAQQLAPATLQNKEYRLKRFEKDLGRLAVLDIDVRAVAEYLSDNFKRDSYVKHRGALADLFRFAKTKGWYPSERDNPAEVTYSKTDYGKDRQRMNLEQYRAIHAIAPRWMQIAMELAVVTLQGRHEVIHLKYSDETDGALYITRQKTKKNEWAHLRIPVTPEIRDIISRSRDDVVSPFVVHRTPTRRVRAGGREHWTQLMANNFTEQFRTLRDKTGLFNDMPKEQRPTFHEIRSLGSWLYEKAGYSQGYVQALMAHSDEKMTAYYQAGHEQKWMTVAAELSLKSILYK